MSMYSSENVIYPRTIIKVVAIENTLMRLQFQIVHSNKCVISLFTHLPQKGFIEKSTNTQATEIIFHLQTAT